MTNQTIDTLLAARRARRAGPAGSPAVARAHLRLNRMLWSEYRTLSRHCPALSRQPVRISERDAASRRVIRRLETAGVLIPVNGQHRFRSGIARRYLACGWLEELAYCAMIEAGAEEACYAQTIDWAAGEARGTSEIDVIARRGDTLTCVICRTASPTSRHDHRSSSELAGRILESPYWEEHFARGKARAFLITTTDLLDTARARPQSRTLLAHATVLDVDSAERDFLTWDRLIAAMREHW